MGLRIQSYQTIFWLIPRRKVTKRLRRIKKNEKPSNSDAGIVPKKKPIMMIKCRKRNGSRLLVLRMKKNLKMPLMNPTTKPKNEVLVLEKRNKKKKKKEFWLITTA